MSKDGLRNLIDRTVDEFCKAKGFCRPDPLVYDLGVTRDPEHGDLATNVAFKLVKAASSKPSLIADELVLMIEKSAQKSGKAVGLDRVVMAGGGFINFYMSKGSLAQVLLDVHRKGKNYGRSEFGKGKKILMEFVSANPTGPLTIAHGRQAAVGDSMARILEATGHGVYREYYLNDAGRQMSLLGRSLWARYCDELKINAAFPEEGYQGDYLVEIAKKLVAEKSDTILQEKQEAALKFCESYASEVLMERIREDLARIGVRFDNYFSEKTLYKKNAVEKTLEFLREKGVLFEEGGALWFRSTQYGDDKDRVVKKSSGEFTYLAPDVAYHRAKFERGYNRLINLWGPDHHGYVSRLKSACQALGHNREEIEIRIVQLTTLYRNGEPVRMSTRAGEFVTLKELMDDVGVDAARFFFIMRKVESHLDFDLDLAKNQSQENPVYYLQYAHARIQSILEFSQQAVTPKIDLELFQTEAERNLIKLISDYPKALIQAAELFEPYRVVDYLRELAGCFHKFYSLHRVVSEDKELTKARLLLCDAVRIVLRNGLELLGISQPDSM